MSALRDALTEHADLALPLGGFLIGFLFGAVVYKTNFCTMGALSDMRTFGDKRRFRAWLLAIAVAMAGAQALDATGLIALDKSMYLSPNLNWAGNIAGGLLFGFGMVFAGGCASRNLARAGGGDLRAVMTLVLMGLFAYMTTGGVLGPARASLDALTTFGTGAASQALPDLIARWTGEGAYLQIAVAAAIVVPVLIFCFAAEDFRTSPLHMASGAGVGLCVITGWALTGLAFDDMAAKPVAPISLTFVRPTGDTLDWLGRFTALGAPGFGVSSVFGVLAGAFAVALAMGRFKIATFSGTSDTVRNVAGAALMGIGGVMALGCTVGQGITGLSTLAAGSFLTFFGIIAGGYAGLAALERQLENEA